jgi:hypothetical protein
VVSPSPSCPALKGPRGAGDDQVATLYGADFIRTSIVSPQAYIEKGEVRLDRGDVPYRTHMPTFGPAVDPPHHMSLQELADLVAFLMQRAEP